MDVSLRFWQLLLYNHLFLIVRYQTKISKVLYFSGDLWKDMSLFPAHFFFFTEFMTQLEWYFSKKFNMALQFQHSAAMEIWGSLYFNASFLSISKVTSNLQNASIANFRNCSISKFCVPFVKISHIWLWAFNLLVSYPNSSSQFGSCVLIIPGLW